MKLFYAFLLITLSTAAFAQQPQKGFSRKYKTEQPADNLSRRIDAEELPAPVVRKAKQSLIGGQAAQSGLQPLRIRVVRDSDTGLPIYIENRSARSVRTQTGSTQLTGQARANAVATTYQFLDQVRGLLKIDKPESSFSVRQTE
ncbi:MAG: neutral protease, partial [Rudanella sp.]|nr:neutral protease [Rudanella sp.]